MWRVIGRRRVANKDTSLASELQPTVTVTVEMVELSLVQLKWLGEHG
jgi:hypothetical protein